MENNSTSPPDAVKPAVLRSELEQAQRITSYLARGIRECVNHHNDEISGGIGDTIHSTAKGKINLQRPSTRGPSYFGSFEQLLPCEVPLETTEMIEP